MLKTNIYGEKQASSQQKLDSFRLPLSELLKDAYFITSSSPPYLLPSPLRRISNKDNKAVIRKYYPKKIVSGTYGLNKLPKCLTSCTKSLKSLTARHPHQIKTSPSSVKRLELLKITYMAKNYPLEFKKTMLAYKDVTMLKIKGSFAGEPFRYIMYLRNIQILDIEVNHQQLRHVSKSIVGLNALKSVSVLISKGDRYPLEHQEPGPFLVFCEKTLAKKSLKMFKIWFDSTYGHYSSDTFEKLFKCLEKSKVERWDIQTMLLEDQALRIAQTYHIFKQVQKICVYTSLTSTDSEDGLIVNYGPFQSTGENQDKSITIYLQRQEELHPFELVPLLRECPKLEALFVRWTNAPLSNSLLLDKDLHGYQSLKAIYFNTENFEMRNNWLHLLQILENSPLLAKFSVIMSDRIISQRNQDENQDKAFNSVQTLTQRLMQINTLKNFELSLSAQSQTSLDALQDLFESLKNLEQLQLDLNVAPNLIIPVIQFDTMINLTELRFSIPSSAQKYLINLIVAITQLTKLRRLHFGNNGGDPIFLEQYLHLMKDLTKLHALEEFRIYSMIRSPSSVTQDDSSKDVTIDTIVEIIHQEIRKLIAHCQKLDHILVHLMDSSIKSSGLVVKFIKPNYQE